MKNQAKVAGHFLGDRLRPGGSLGSLGPGQGAVVRVGTERLAVYRDDDGDTHALSARCTHLGCLVAFNSAERAWECPCHGSRFDIDGEVVQGPAVRPLERRRLRTRDAEGTGGRLRGGARRGRRVGEPVVGGRARLPGPRGAYS
ncbi:hypothetical protein GCM10020256_14480 [Streptomyces thermocoprophilus]